MPRGRRGRRPRFPIGAMGFLLPLPPRIEMSSFHAHQMIIPLAQIRVSASLSLRILVSVRKGSLTRVREGERGRRIPRLLPPIFGFPRAPRALPGRSPALPESPPTPAPGAGGGHPRAGGVPLCLRRPGNGGGGVVAPEFLKRGDFCLTQREKGKNVIMRFGGSP